MPHRIRVAERIFATVTPVVPGWAGFENMPVFRVECWQNHRWQIDHPVLLVEYLLPDECHHPFLRRERVDRGMAFYYFASCDNCGAVGDREPTAAAAEQVFLEVYPRARALGVGAGAL